jgi:hypothetical protein
MGDVDTKPPPAARSFGQLCAMFRGQADSNEEEIDACSLPRSN